MDIEVEFESGIPLYEQITHQLRRLIETGQIQPGEQLLTTRQLAVQLGINFNTVARAYRLLDQEGLISTQPGRGTYALDQQQDPAKRKTHQDHIEELTRFYVRKAAYLGFSPKEVQDCLDRIVREEHE
jgi:DNA-binding transcriptional regulator YhcF (GntR family)